MKSAKFHEMFHNLNFLSNFEKEFAIIYENEKSYSNATINVKYNSSFTHFILEYSCTAESKNNRDYCTAASKNNREFGFSKTLSDCYLLI